MDTEDSVCVALLHDVVEDTNITFEDLINEGFNSEIIAALRLLTHLDDTPYMEYVREIKTNPLARKVKLADLKHNSDLSRLDLTVDKIPPKLKLYKEAIKYLEM
jgi:(p)ppGpp synthase/HD superfamily hydrolase